MRYLSPPNLGTNVQSHNQEDVSVSVATFTADPQCVKPVVGGWVGIYVGMNSVCTNSGGTAPGVGRPGVGMNLISSLPCTSTGAVPIVSGGDVLVVGNRTCIPCSVVILAPFPSSKQHKHKSHISYLHNSHTKKVNAKM